MQSFFTWLNGWVSTVGDWLSVLTFFVSGYTLFTISRVRTELISRAMLPNFIVLLTDGSSRLSNLLADFDKNKDDIEIEIAKALVNIKAITIRSAGETRNKAKAAAKQIRYYDGGSWFGRSKELDIRGARAIYIAMMSLIEQLKRQSDEQKFGG